MKINVFFNVNSSIKILQWIRILLFHLNVIKLFQTWCIHTTTRLLVDLFIFLLLFSSSELFRLNFRIALTWLHCECNVEKHQLSKNHIHFYGNFFPDCFVENRSNEYKWNENESKNFDFNFLNHLFKINLSKYVIWYFITLM